MFERFWFAINGVAIAAMVWGAQEPAGTLATVAFWILMVFGSITAIAFFLGGIFNIFKDDDLAIEAIKFEEATATETGFKPIFDEQILPILRNVEKVRHKASASMNTFLPLTISSFFYLLYDRGLFGWIALIGAIVIYAIWHGRSVLSDYDENLRDLISRPLCAFLGGVVHQNMLDDKAKENDEEPESLDDGEHGGRFDVDAFLATGVLGPGNVETDDIFRGTRKGVVFQCAEAKFTPEGTSSSSDEDSEVAKSGGEKFKGLFIRFSAPPEITSRLSVRDRRLSGGQSTSFPSLKSRESGASQDVKLHSSLVLENSDAAVAELYLTPERQEALSTLATQIEGEGTSGHLALVAEDGWVNLAVPCKDDIFKLSGGMESLSTIDVALHRAFAGFDLVFDLVEVLGQPSNAG